MQVDEDKRQIWFSASGMYPGKDPYFVHYYRINFDGTGLTPLTDGRREPRGQALAGPEVLRRHVLARRCRAGHRAAPHRGRQPRDAAREGGHRGARQGRAGSRRKSSSRRGATARPTSGASSSGRPTSIPRRSTRSSRTSTPARRARSCRSRSPRSTRCRRRPRSASSSCRSTAWARATVEGVPRRRVEEPQGRRLPGSDPVAQGRRREVPVLRHHPRRPVRHVGRRPELARRPAVLPGVLQGGRVLGAAVTTTAWTRSGGTSSGWAGRIGSAVRRVVQRRQRLSPAGQGAAGRRRDGHQRRSVLDDAGRQPADQAQQGFRSARRSRHGARHRAARTAITSATTSSRAICSTSTRRNGRCSRTR